jgi:phosphatidylinositol alpha-mannosyltransferase
VPIKVAVVTQAYRPVVGGVTEHVDAMARELRTLGHRVTVITANFSTAGLENGDADPDVVRMGRNVVVPYNGAENNITVGFGLARRLRAELQRGGYDVVHVHCPLSPLLPLLALRHARQPLVGTFHTASASDLPFRLFKRPLRALYARIDRVIAVSEAASEYVSRHFDGPITIVPNGVDLERFRPGLPRPARFDDGTPNILFVGRFDPRKGLPELMTACDMLAREGLPFRLILAGDGRLRARLERMASGALRGRVHFEGRVLHDRLPCYYAAADLFCSPARGGESFGLVLLEAMAAGVPIVATDIAGYRCVVTHDAEGILVAPRDPAALADAIRRLLLDEALRARLGARGVETATRYGWDRVARDLEGILCSAAGAPSPRPTDAPGRQEPLTPAAI